MLSVPLAATILERDTFKVRLSVDYWNLMPDVEMRVVGYAMQSAHRNKMRWWFDRLP